MNLTRYLSEELIVLDMRPPLPEPEEPDFNREKFRQQQKETVLAELTDLLERSGNVINKRKLLTDLINRERRASTGLSRGIAVPHVRTSNIRELTIAITRSREGIDFDAADEGLSHFFFIVVAPPHGNEDLYLKIYKHLAEVTAFEGALGELLEVESAGEMIRLLRRWE
jgi:PTS system fructose-specific IIC component